MSNVTCPICFRRCPSRRRFICHMLSDHKDDGVQYTVFCAIRTCSYRTRSYSALKSHYRRCHPLHDIDICLNSNNTVDIQENAEHFHVDVQHGDDLESVLMFDLRKRLAKYLLNMEAKFKLSKVSLNFVATFTENLFSDFHDYIQTKINDLVLREQLSNIFSDNTTLIFDQFKTVYGRENLYKNQFGLVEPQSILMGNGYHQVKGRKIHKKSFGYFIPFVKQLKLLLNNPQVWHYYKHVKKSKDDLMRDVSDGEYIRNHPFTLANKPFLQIVLNYDDVEFQNALRSNHKYKLSLFYFTILNIPVEYRSRLSSIFLLAAAPSSSVQMYGIKHLLSDFITSMRRLSSEGMQIQIGNNLEEIFADLIFCIADNPAAAVLAGMKKSCSFALKPCRNCWAEKAQMRTNFRECHFELRSMERHLECCSVLHDKDLSKTNYNHWSTMYGVTCLSPLYEINHFPLTENIIQDNMHNYLEGICPLKIAHLLKRYIVDLDMFTLDWFNDEIMSFPYSKSQEGHKPVPLERKDITTNMKVRQKATACLCLLQVMPYVLGPFFKDTMCPFYENFLQMVQIVKLSFCPYATNDTAGQLETLIEIFCQNYVALYGTDQVARPKLHFLLHTPRLITKFGSLHSLSTLRFEAKNGLFKSKTWHCFKNMSLSISKMHQIDLLNNLIDDKGCPSKKFVYAGDVLGKVVASYTLGTLPDEIQRLLNLNFPQITPQMHIDECKDCSIDGIKYREGCALIKNWDESNIPSFGILRRILVINNQKYFFMEDLETGPFTDYLNAYEVTKAVTCSLYKFHQFKNVFPLDIYNCKQSKSHFISNWYFHCAEGM